MFPETLKKQFHWNIMSRHTVKLTLNKYFMKYSERKISQCILPLKKEGKKTFKANIMMRSEKLKETINLVYIFSYVEEENI